MDFKMRKYEVCPKCHNIKQIDDFSILEVEQGVLTIENKCYTCGLVEEGSYSKFVCNIPKGGK